MFKSIIIGAVAIVCTFSSLSQVQPQGSPMYLKVYGGYGLLHPGGTKGRSSTAPSIDTTFYNTGKKAFGDGIRMGVGIGFIVSDFINLGVDGEYLSGAKMMVPVSRKYDKISIESNTITKYHFTSIIPNITLKAVSNSSYYIYNRTGVIIAFPPKITEEYSYSNDSTIGTNFNDPYRHIQTHYFAQYEMKLGLGFQSCFGVQVKILDQLRMLFEIAAYRISFNKMKYEENNKLRQYFKGYFNNGADQADYTDNSRNVINFSSQGSGHEQSQGTPNQMINTLVYPQAAITISEITMNIGFFFRF